MRILAAAATMTMAVLLNPAEMDRVTAGHPHDMPTQDIVSTGGFYCSGTNCVHFDAGAVIPQGSFNKGGLYGHK